MRIEDEPALAPSADSLDGMNKRAKVGKGLLLFFIAFAGMMFALYAAIIVWTGMAAA